MTIFLYQLFKPLSLYIDEKLKLLNRKKWESNDNNDFEGNVHKNDVERNMGR